MPFANPFLKAVSSLDPCNRKTSVALELMKELPLYASNVVQDSEKEAYDLEIHNFQNDHFSDIVEESVDLWWGDVENTLKYPILSRMTFALLTCFHEPKVESSFSIMNNVITPGSNRLNVSTFNAMQCINSKYTCRQVFTTDQEGMLCDYIIETSNMIYGLTCKQVKQLAHGYSECLGSSTPSSWNENNIAGIHWVKHL
ncbi:hypothetical protein AVEN_227507-1 [Araneus ventricosus]|uniref:HAT C-terminal dimerisation domain-containing protein n=1 Tax=Araneus ventricosus TaxID=182803 RepID=A0A4Y2C5E8_ARAVE|nr:hypothetical protein AVEN_227507-1 [Araneus ventricosus]